MATYPTAVKSFTSKVDNVDTIDASDINVAYDEIAAVEGTVGVSPATSVASGAASWNGAYGYNWGTVKARLDNIELGVAGDAHGALYVHQGGGDTIQPAATSVVPLTVRGALNSGVNTFQVQDGTGTTRVHVDNLNYQLYQSGQVVPWIIKCGVVSVTIPAGATSMFTDVSFGGFTVAPIVFTTINGSLWDVNSISARVYDILPNTATVWVSTEDPVSADTVVQVFWLAIQGLRTGTTAAIS